MKKRAKIQKYRVVKDDEITKYLSSKFIEEDTANSKTIRKIVLIINKLSVAYFRLLGMSACETANTYNFLQSEQ